MKFVAHLSRVGASMLLLAGSSNAFAATITVNNNVGAVADHSTMAAAIAAASTGDTILVAGSATSYGTATLDKQLKIVGPGFFLTENSIPGVTPGIDDQPASMALSFANTTVSGSRFVGLTITGITYGTVDTDLLWDRCRFTFSVAWSGATDFRVTRCYFDGNLQIGSTTLASKCINSTAIGCIMNRLYLYQGAVASHCTVIGSGQTHSITVDSGSSVTNSILIRWSNNGFPPAISGSVTNCVAIAMDLLPTGTGNPDINGNYDNIPFADIGTVLLVTGAGDGYWRLNTTNAANPALAHASDGTDIGAYGGPIPYRLSGQPSIPKISNLVVPGLASPTSGLNVKVTVTEPTP